MLMVSNDLIWLSNVRKAVDEQRIRNEIEKFKRSVDCSNCIKGKQLKFIPYLQVS